MRPPTVASLFALVCLAFASVALPPPVAIAADIAPPARAAAAQAVVDDYLAAHNLHDLAAEMAFYDADAQFVRSQKRGTIRGVREIEALLRFDEHALSWASPRQLTVRQDGNDVVVDMGTALEHSRVFIALGIPLMRTMPTAEAFRIRAGRLQLIRQPEFTAPCAAVAAAAMRQFAAWVPDGQPDAYAALYKDGALQVRADLVDLWVRAIVAWRRATGWRPSPDMLEGCVKWGG